MTSKDMVEVKRAEQAYIKRVKMQIQEHVKELNNLNFQNYNGSYYDFLKAQRVIQHKINMLNEELSYFNKLINADDKPKSKTN